MKFIFLALLLSLFCSSCRETESKRRTVGYKGEAKSNPFLAAGRLLDTYDIEAATEHSLGELDYSVSTLFIPPSSLNTVGRSKRMLDWVSNGGHLVLMFEGGELNGNDFTMSPRRYLWAEESPAGLDYLFEELSISLVGGDDDDYSDIVKTVTDAADPDALTLNDWEEMEEQDRVLLDSRESIMNLGNNGLRVNHWGRKSFQCDNWEEGDYASKDDPESEDSHHYLSLSYGDGRISLLSDARPLRNRYIAYGDHAEFLMNTVDLSRPGTVIFSGGGRIGFAAMVWKHFKLAVIALLVVVVFWLWKNLPRHGPQLDVEAGEMREFSDQIRGIGRFLWQHKRDDALLGGLRAHLNRRLSLHAGVSDEGIFEQLSEMSGLPVESVIEAMTREHITEPGVMVRVTQNLQEILKNIH